MYTFLPVMSSKRLGGLFRRWSSLYPCTQEPSKPHRNNPSLGLLIWPIHRRVSSTRLVKRPRHHYRVSTKYHSSRAKSFGCTVLCQCPLTVVLYELKFTIKKKALIFEKGCLLEHDTILKKTRACKAQYPTC